MKIKHLLVLALLLGATSRVAAQTANVKINVASAAIGILNPSFEFGFKEHSALTFDYMGAFAKKNYMGTGHPFIFSMGMGGYRYYVKGDNQRGFFFGGEVGGNMFKMHKNMIPLVSSNSQKNRYDVGHGFVLGAVLGYKLPLGGRWDAEASISGGWQYSIHEIYNNDGVRLTEYNPSAEWTPYKGGIYLSYRLW